MSGTGSPAPDSRMLGWVLLIAGGALVIIAIVWGRTGFYASQAPLLLLLLAAGAGLAFGGSRLLRKPKQDDGPVDWRSRDGS